MIAIIDYNIGNISAVANMLQRIGVQSIIASKPNQIEQAERIILPGNGSFDACMRNLRESGMVPMLTDQVMNKKVPILGICVGAQMLGKDSEEGTEAGLGWLDMHVRRFPEKVGLRVPHMGWNQAIPKQSNNPLLIGLEDEVRYYFVHSYYMDPANESEIMLETNYGIEFASGISRGNISGVQFHPEKSHKYGKQLLAAFAKN